MPCLLVEGWQNQTFEEEVQMKFMVILTKKCPKCKGDLAGLGKFARKMAEFNRVAIQ